MCWKRAWPKKGRSDRKGMSTGWKGVIFGGVVEDGRISLKQKKPNEEANIVIPIPVTC